MKAANAAIKSAGAAEALTRQLKDLIDRKNIAKLFYQVKLNWGLELLRDTSPQAATQYREAGWTPDSLRRAMDGTMYEWRTDVYARHTRQANVLSEFPLRSPVDMSARRRLWAMNPSREGGNDGRN